MAQLDPVDLLAYCVQEFSGVANHLAAAMLEAQHTGKIPESLFGDQAQNGTVASGTAKPAKPAAKKAKPAADKKPRQLTAFNWYVKAQIAELKKNGTTETTAEGKPVNLMTMAGARWKELGAEGQAEFTKKFKALQANGEIPASQASGQAAAEAKKRKAEEAPADASAAEQAGPSTEVAANPSSKKDKAVAEPVSSPVTAPATQGAAQEGHKKKKKKHHKSASEVHASPESAPKQTGDEGKKSEEKKKKKHKHRESGAAAT